mgnify:FL=1
MYVMNKIDQITLEELDLIDRMPNYCPVWMIQYPIDRKSVV